MKAAPSQIHSVTKKAHDPIETIELPTNNIRAYQTLFDTINESFKLGEIIKVMTIKLNEKNFPPTAYYAMKKTSSDLSMVRYTDDLAWRISDLLFPDLSKKLFAFVFLTSACR